MNTKQVYREFLEEAVLEKISELKDTKSVFLQAQQLDITNEILFDRTAGAHPDTVDEGRAHNEASLLEFSVNEDGTESSGNISIIRDEGCNILTLAVHAPDPDTASLQSARFEEVESPWDVMQLLSDESILQIADHIRLQKEVKTFALAAIAEAHNAKQEAEYRDSNNFIHGPTAEGSAYLVLGGESELRQDHAHIENTSMPHKTRHTKV